MRARLVGVLVAAVMVTVGSPAGAAPDNEADPAVCAATAAHDGTAADQPPMDYREDGDLYIDGEWVWDCPPYEEGPPGPPRAPAAHLTIHRFPSVGTGPTGARLYVHPGPNYVCRDVHTGAVVGQGAALTMPHPGVACDPTVPFSDAVRCIRVGAGGYHADLGFGAVVVTSSCSTFSASHATTPSNSRTSASGEGRTTWFCQVTESLTAQQPLADYWAFCDINSPR